MALTFFHTGLIVPDIERALHELSGSAGLRWSPILDRSLTDEWHSRIAFSLDGPHHLEVIQGSPGSPWDASDGGGLHHLGYWSDDVAGDRARLEAQGVSVILDGEAWNRNTAYHLASASGTRLELLDIAYRDEIGAAYGVSF